MAYVRKKGNKFYLVESKRILGKVCQKHLAYLGSSDTIQGRLDFLENREAGLRNHLNRCVGIIENREFYNTRMRKKAVKFIQMCEKDLAKVHKQLGKLEAVANGGEGRRR
jgi:hypothetical protein